MAAREHIGNGGAGMDRWSDFGLLGKAACISFMGGMIGMGLAVVLGKLFDSDGLAKVVLVIWFAPAAIWAVCAFVATAREEYPATAGCLTLLAALGAIGNPDQWESVPLMLLACPIVTGIAAIFGKPAKAVLAVGRGKARSSRGIDL